MTAVTIVYHSNSGHTARLAEAVEHGAASVQGARVSRLEIAGGDIVNGRWENNEIMTSLDASDAIIFGAPTSMGDVSGQMKCRGSTTRASPAWRTVSTEFSAKCARRSNTERT